MQHTDAFSSITQSSLHKKRWSKYTTTENIINLLFIWSQCYFCTLVIWHFIYLVLWSNIRLHGIFFGPLDQVCGTNSYFSKYNSFYLLRTRRNKMFLDCLLSELLPAKPSEKNVFRILNFNEQIQFFSIFLRNCFRCQDHLVRYGGSR